MDLKTKGSLSVLAGAFLISFSPVFVNLVTIEPTVSGFYRMAIGSIALLIAFILKTRESPFKKSISIYISRVIIYISSTNN